MIDKEGISQDPTKIAAIKDMPQPKNIKELQRFLGMVNQLGKFSSNISTISAPLRMLLSKIQAWLWGLDQSDSYRQLQNELTAPKVLRHYNSQAPTKISATERRYAQIEKEALAIVWACEKFSSYVLGKQILLETNHKPLVPLMSYKHLDNLPPWVL